MAGKEVVYINTGTWRPRIRMAVRLGKIPNLLSTRLAIYEAVRLFAKNSGLRLCARLAGFSPSTVLQLYCNRAGTQQTNAFLEIA